MLSIFSSCDQYTKSKLLQSFCLSLYGVSLWMASSPDLYSLEVSLNNILRKIWSLPQHCHTGILQLVVGLTLKKIQLHWILLNLTGHIGLQDSKPGDTKFFLWTSFFYQLLGHKYRGYSKTKC